jgi:hypothetical protein
MTSASCHYVLTVDKSCVPPVQSSSKKKKEKKNCMRTKPTAVCMCTWQRGILVAFGCGTTREAVLWISSFKGGLGEAKIWSVV